MGMGRPPLYPHFQTRADRGGPRWPDPTVLEWSGVVGERIRRLRQARDLTLVDMTDRVLRPATELDPAGGRRYTHGYFSRIERGYASAPMYVYLAIADALEVHPGRMMGADDAERDPSPEEMTLINFIRLQGIAPAVAIHVLATTPTQATTADPVVPALRPRPELEHDGPQEPRLHWRARGTDGGR